MMDCNQLSAMNSTVETLNKGPKKKHNILEQQTQTRQKRYRVLAIVVLSACERKSRVTWPSGLYFHAFITERRQSYILSI